MRTCISCGRQDSLIYDEQNYVCTACGAIQDNSLIVDEAEFDNVTNTRIGRHVSLIEGECGGISLMKRSLSLISEDKRKLMAANKLEEEIRNMIQLLRIPKNLETSIRATVLLLCKNELTKLEKVRVAVASCVYIICRQRNIPITLLDVANVSEMDVYKLGSKCKNICQQLGVSLEAQDPINLVEKVISDLSSEMHLPEESKTKLAQATTILVQVACKEWLDSGRRPITIVASAIVIAAESLSLEKVTLEYISQLLSLKVRSVRDRHRELTQMLIKLSSQLSWAKSITKKSFEQHLPFVLDNLTLLYRLYRSNILNESKQQDQVAPPSFVRSQQKRKDRIESIDRAKKRIREPNSYDQEHVNKKDKRIEDLLRAGVSERAIQDGYYHIPIVINDKERLEDQEITDQDMDPQELETYLKDEKQIKIEMELLRDLGDGNVIH